MINISLTQPNDAMTLRFSPVYTNDSTVEG